jgi:hypothetical protein
MDLKRQLSALILKKATDKNTIDKAYGRNRKNLQNYGIINKLIGDINNISSMRDFFNRYTFHCLCR